MSLMASGRRTGQVRCAFAAMLLVACGGAATEHSVSPDVSAAEETVSEPAPDPEPGGPDRPPEVWLETAGDETGDVPYTGEPELILDAAELVPDLGSPELPESVDPNLDSDHDGLPDLKEIELGTDPMKADSDQDGIADGAEVGQGTDPRNPASASAWHPELTARPRLFFGPEAMPVLAARAQSKEGPYQTLWQRATAAAERPLPVYPAGDFDFDVNRELADIAEASALKGLLLQDAGLVAKAMAAIAAPFPDPSYLDIDSKYDLREAEALVAFCTAFDLVAASPLADQGALAEARANLVNRIDAFRFMCHEGSQFPLLVVVRNNHTMKFFGAMGLCAMALNDRPEAASDISEAMTGLDYLLNHFQGTDEGGYAEGWNYLVYGSESFIQFLAAYHRWADGQALPYYGVPRLQFGSEHADRIDVIEDFAVNDRTRAIYLRALQSSRPDGLLPPTDDANPSALHGGLLAWLFNEPAFLWQWFKEAAGLYTGQAAVATFALYDGSEPPQDPGLPLYGSFPEAGFALYRSAWTSDAIYFVLQGEHGPARVNGQGHEHPDELSFLMHGFGAPLVIDPGYINWENHNLVKYASDHNTILVDGKGAEYKEIGGQALDVGSDAFLGPMTHDGSFYYVSVTTSYQGVNLVRRLILVDGRYLVVEDRMDAQGAHTYTWLLNGWGGGDVPSSSFELLGDGGRWSGPLARLEAHVAPVGKVLKAASVSSKLEEHAVVWGQWAMHERLAFEVTQGEGAGFLAVVLPAPASEGLPQVEMSSGPAGVAWASWRIDDSTRYSVVVNRTGTAVEVGAWTAGPGTTVRIERAGAGVEELMLPAAG